MLSIKEKSDSRKTLDVVPKTKITNIELEM